MHLIIIAQYLNLFEPGKDRLWALSKNLISRGNEVTILTGNSGNEIKLGNKMIGLTEQDGINLVSLNINYSADMEPKGKLLAYLKFKRLIEKQGLKVPKPDAIMALSPPITVMLAALKLCKHYKVPFIAEIRELWPDAPIQRGTLKNKLFVKIARKWEEKIYEEADRIVAGSTGIASTVKDRWVERAKITVIPQMDHEEAVKLYSQLFEGLGKKVNY